MALGRLVLTVALATVVALLAVYVGLGHYFDLPEAALLVEHNASIAATFYSDRLSHAASAYDDATGQYIWGRTTTPRFSMDVCDVNPVLHYMQMKEFIWLSVTSGDWLIGIAVLQFHYMSTLTMQVLHVDRVTSQNGATSPFPSHSLRGRLDVPLISELTTTGGVWRANKDGQMGPSVAGHTVLFRPPPWSRSGSQVNLTFSGSTIELTARSVVEDAPRYSRDAHATNSRARRPRAYVVEINGTAPMPTQWMGLAFPLGLQRPALVQKMAAVPMQSSAHLRITPQDGEATAPFATDVVLDKAYFSLDYTRGVLRRHTEWYWASVSGPSGVGLHLSAATYDVRNVSMESTLFDSRAGTGGTARFLDEAVSFVRLPNTNRTQWSIRSAKETVSMVFTPCGGHDGAVNVGLINVNLDHQWGTFRGHVRMGDDVVLFEDVPGVFEEHFALW